MCCKEGEITQVSYDTKIVTKNSNVEARKATSIYFTNKGGTSAFVNDIEVGVGETLKLKNDPCHEIVTNFQVIFGAPIGELPFANQLAVLYEYKKNVKKEDCKK